MGIERQNMRHVLIRPDDDHATLVAVNTPRFENVLVIFHVGAEHLFVVAEPVPSFARQQQSRHGLEHKRAMALLEDRPDIDHGIDVGRGRGKPSDRRGGGLGQIRAQFRNARGWICGIFSIGYS